MRIALVSPYSWHVPGGVQVHVRQLASHLRARGHVVCILAPGDAAADPDGAIIVGRAVGIRGNGSVAPVCLSRRSSFVVRRALREFQPDVIHVHEPFAPSTSLLAVLHRNAPVLATFHANVAERSLHAMWYRLASPMLAPVWRRIDRRVAVSDAARRTVQRRLPPAEVVIVPNGADVRAFATARPAALPPGRRVLFVGRLESRKGFPVAVRAFQQLAATIPDLQLIVVGEGRDRIAVDALDAATRARVHMLGRVPNEELPRYHRASDIFLSPALGGESFGIVLVEAMAAGLPIVASDISGYRDVARHGIEALLFPRGDAAAAARAVQQLLAEPETARALVARGRTRAQEFAWEVVVDRLEGEYEALARRSRRATPREFASI